MEKAVAQWQQEEEEEEEEVMAEVGLRGRQPRQSSQPTTTSTVTVTTVANRVESSNHEEFNDKYKGYKGGNEEVAISETRSFKLLEAQVPAAASSSNRRAETENTGNIKETIQDETELYLDSVYKKQVAHDFLCPNCNSCIEKVIVLVYETDSEPIHTFGCISCFSFLTPAGDWSVLNFTSNEQWRRSKQDSPYDSLTKKTPLLPGQAEPQPSETLHDRSNHDSSTNNPTPPVETVGLDLSSGTAKFPKPDRENGAYPKTDTVHAENFEIEREIVYLLMQMSKTQEIEPDGKENEGDKDTSAAVDTELHPSTLILIPEADEDGQKAPSQSRDDKKLEILKSIVYGGLTESVTSLTVVTSAASANATTLNIVALALANLVGGLLIIGHSLRELKNEQPRGTSDQTNERVDQHQEQLGQKQNFIVHATVAFISFLVFDLVPPLVYGFSFRKSDNKDYKLAAVAAASLLCIIILAICKAYVQKPPKNYIKTVMYYAVAGIMASGVAYIAGDLIGKPIKNFGWFDSEDTLTIPLAEMSSGRHAWASY